MYPLRKIRTAVCYQGQMFTVASCVQKASYRTRNAVCSMFWVILVQCLANAYMQMQIPTQEDLGRTWDPELLAVSPVSPVLLIHGLQFEMQGWTVHIHLCANKYAGNKCVEVSTTWWIWMILLSSLCTFIFLYIMHLYQLYISSRTGF